MCVFFCTQSEFYSVAFVLDFRVQGRCVSKREHSSAFALIPTNQNKEKSTFYRNFFSVLRSLSQHQSSSFYWKKIWSLVVVNLKKRSVSLLFSLSSSLLCVCVCMFRVFKIKKKSGEKERSF